MLIQSHHCANFPQGTVFALSSENVSIIPCRNEGSAVLEYDSGRMGENKLHEQENRLSAE